MGLRYGYSVWQVIPDYIDNRVQNAPNIGPAHSTNFFDFTGQSLDVNVPVSVDRTKQLNSTNSYPKTFNI